MGAKTAQQIDKLEQIHIAKKGAASVRLDAWLPLSNRLS